MWTDRPYLSHCVHGALHRKLGALQEAAGDQTVVHRYDQQGEDVEAEEGGHGVKLGVQPPLVGVGGAGDEALIGGGDPERVEVRVHGLGDRQDQGDHPDERRPQNDGGGAG